MRIGGRGRSRAAGAGSDDVEAVPAEREVLLLGEDGKCAVQVGFEVVGERDVGHGSAGGAREVMVVTEGMLGELESGVLARVVREAMDEIGFFENGERAVDAAEWCRGPDTNLVDGQRLQR